MGFVEAVVGELLQKVEDLARLPCIDAVRGLGAVDEFRAFAGHLLGVLLAHRAPQQVRAAKAVARHDLRDLHHLFLIDDDALGFGQDVVDGRVDGFQIAEAVLDLAIGRDVLHRAGTVQRHQRYDILDAGRLHASQRIHHAAGFHLEHRDRLRTGVERIGYRVIQRDQVDIDRHPPRRQKVQRVPDHRQRLQAQEVELHQPRRLDPFHVELGRGHVRPRVLIERHQLVQRAVADDHARRVGRGIAQKPLDLLRIVQQTPHDLFAPRRLAQARLVRQRLLDADRLHPLDRDQLGQPVHLAVGHLQDASHVAHRRLGQQRAEGDDLPDPVAAVAVLHVGDHLFPAVHAEVDVEVRHRRRVRGSGTARTAANNARDQGR